MILLKKNIFRLSSLITVLLLGAIVFYFKAEASLKQNNPPIITPPAKASFVALRDNVARKDTSLRIFSESDTLPALAIYPSYDEPPVIKGFPKAKTPIYASGRFQVANTNGIKVRLYSIDDFMAQKEWLDMGLFRRADIHREKARYALETGLNELAEYENSMAEKWTFFGIQSMREPEEYCFADEEGRFSILRKGEGSYVIVAYGLNVSKKGVNHFIWVVPPKSTEAYVKSVSVLD